MVTAGDVLIELADIKGSHHRPRRVVDVRNDIGRGLGSSFLLAIVDDLIFRRAIFDEFAVPITDRDIVKGACC